MLASTFDEEVAVTALYCDTHVRGVDEFTFRFFHFRGTSALTQIIGMANSSMCSAFVSTNIEQRGLVRIIVLYQRSD